MEIEVSKILEIVKQTAFYEVTEVNEVFYVNIDSLKLRLEDYKEAQEKQLNMHDVSMRSEQLCKHPRSERTYIGDNTLKCNNCGLEFK